MESLSTVTVTSPGRAFRQGFVYKWGGKSLCHAWGTSHVLSFAIKNCKINDKYLLYKDIHIIFAKKITGHDFEDIIPIMWVWDVATR